MRTVGLYVVDVRFDAYLMGRNVGISPVIGGHLRRIKGIRPRVRIYAPLYAEAAAARLNRPYVDAVCYAHMKQTSSLTSNSPSL